jgi:two-component system OmpR family sensor kinase
VNARIAEGWARVSLRAKLTALSVALIGILLVVSSFGTVALLRTYLQSNTDAVLTSTASVMKAEDPALVRVRLASAALELPSLPSDYYIAYLDVNGKLLLGIASSANGKIKMAVPNLDKFTIDAVARTQGIPFEVDNAGLPTHDSNGRGWRIVAEPLTYDPGSVVIALPTEANNALIVQYRAIGAGFGALLLVLSALSIWLTITSALRPLKEVERTAKAVADGDISQRLISHEGKTEVARINRALNSMLDSVEDAFTERGKTLEQMRRFLSDASHELRTPLASVRGYAELYRMGALANKSDLTDAMNRIEAEAIRMSELVESLLALARIDEGSEVAKQPADLTQLAKDAAKDAAAAAPKVRINIEGLDGSEASPVEAMVDAASIRRVLINLLSNAIRFSPAKKPVTIAVGVVSGKKILEVRDHGIGIPKQLRGKVFERFYRADNSRNRETGGSGLGLAIVQGIVERHGGTIKVLETPGGGATFRVELP